VTQKLACVVEQVAPHGGGVYSVILRSQGIVPRFRAGQFLHLALDPYDPTRFWPESRVFSIASAPAERETIRITYAVHGRFTSRMEGDLVEGRQVWIKMPYGDFVVTRDQDVVLFAGGTGITAFTAFLESLTSTSPQSVTLAYGARTGKMLIYRELVESCVQRHPGLAVSYFVEHNSVRESAASEKPLLKPEAVDGEAGARHSPVNVATVDPQLRPPSPEPRAPSPRYSPGRVSVETVWPRISRPFDTAFYISGPPPMVRTIGQELRAHQISAEAIHIDAWD
jgi:ferredoxin-NADP reductase